MIQEGKLRLFEVGKCLRVRYTQLFNGSVYTNKLIYIQSDDEDRCLNSAAMILAGMFPPKGHDVWNEHIKWNPFPIHTTKQSLDHVVGQQQNCAKYNWLLQQYIQSDEHQKLIRKYQSLMKYLRKHTGLNVTVLNDCSNIYDTLLTEHLLHLK